MTPSNIALRRGTAADAESIWRVRTQAINIGCRSHYAAQLIDAWLANSMPSSFASRIATEIFVVAEADSRIVGFAGLKASTSEVDAVFVSPEFAGHGLGKRLLLYVESLARELRLPSLSLKASLNSVAFYKAAGYI
jgi:N-acetylglutamate synthase-like GNAT family acetyltransferase